MKADVISLEDFDAVSGALFRCPASLPLSVKHLYALLHIMLFMARSSPLRRLGQLLFRWHLPSAPSAIQSWFGMFYVYDFLHYSLVKRFASELEASCRTMVFVLPPAPSRRNHSPMSNSLCLLHPVTVRPAELVCVPTAAVLFVNKPSLFVYKGTHGSFCAPVCVPLHPSVFCRGA